jgi:formylglycine-generating enzyme required for sulfatase activity
VAQAWALAEHATSLAVIDEFIRQYGHVPIYGGLARTRREELARELAKNQLAMAVDPARPGVLTAAQERGLKPKDTFRECTDCPEMVVVPAGSFTMGSPDGEKDRDKDEGPQHVVTISKPFAVGKVHVTVDQFAAFVRETGYAASSKVLDLRRRQERGARRPLVAQSRLCAGGLTSRDVRDLG